MCAVGYHPHDNPTLPQAYQSQGSDVQKMKTKTTLSLSLCSRCPQMHATAHPSCRSASPTSRICSCPPTQVNGTRNSHSTADVCVLVGPVVYTTLTIRPTPCIYSSHKYKQIYTNAHLRPFTSTPHPLHALDPRSRVRTRSFRNIMHCLKVTLPNTRDAIAHLRRKGPGSS